MKIQAYPKSMLTIPTKYAKHLKNIVDIQTEYAKVIA